MRILILLLIIALFIPKLTAQPQINITNGYAGKPIFPLDSGYLFARSLAPNEIFYRWDLKSFSKTEILDGEFESTVWFRMTPFPIIATPTLRYLSKQLEIQEIQIQGPTLSKSVLYIQAQNPKGTVFLFHKEASFGNEWTPNYYDQNQLVKVLHYYGYSVVFFDCEESATSTEINNDSISNWQILPHSIENNVDYSTCDSVLKRLRSVGIIGGNENIYAIGHGNGGMFAQGFAELFDAKACVVIHSLPNSSTPTVEQSVPVLFNVSVNDKNVENAINQRYVDSLKSINKCASIHYTRPTPLYPEVFSRTGRIPLDISRKLFEELDSNKVLNDSNYLIPTQRELIDDVIANPSKWPQARFLNSSFSTSYIRQLSISGAESEFNSNRVSALVDFLEFPCQVNTSVSRETTSFAKKTSHYVGIEGTITLPITNSSEQSITIVNLLGVIIPLPFTQSNKNEITIDFRNQMNGIYFLMQGNELVATIVNNR